MNGLLDHFGDFLRVELEFLRRFQIIRLDGDLRGPVKDLLQRLDDIEGGIGRFLQRADVLAILAKQILLHLEVHHPVDRGRIVLRVAQLLTGGHLLLQPALARGDPAELL